MTPHQRRAAQQKQQRLDLAIAVLQKHPRYPAVMVSIFEQEKQVSASRTQEHDTLNSSERFGYFAQYLDIRGEAYAQLVTDLSSHAALRELLSDLIEWIFREVTGIPLSFIPPVGPGQKLSSHQTIRKLITERALHWGNEGMKQIAAAIAVPQEQSAHLEPSAPLALNTLLAMVEEFDTLIREKETVTPNFTVSAEHWCQLLAFFNDVQQVIPGVSFDPRYEQSPVYVRTSLRGVRAQIVGAMRQASSVAATPASSNTPIVPSFPNRSKWARDRLHERAWNVHDPRRFSGPNHRTVTKIVEGHSVREDALEKLIFALNQKKPSGIAKNLTPQDIPTD
jgi:hypothetical protein